MPREMTPRERVLTAMRRQVPDRVPKEASPTPAVYERFKQETGSDDWAGYWGIEVRHVGFKGPKELPDFRAFYDEELPPNTNFNEYGVAHVPGDFYHFFRYRFPLARARSVAELENYPWPDFTPNWRHEHLEEQVAALQRAGFYVAGSVGHIFENAWQIRSMEMLFEDMLTRPEMAAYILDRLTEDRAFQAKRYAEAGCDDIHCGDDVGMQKAMMMSPEMWREWFKPRWAYVFQTARKANPDILVWYHSDGNIEPIIPDLIEIGLNILNPVQPECMDPVKLKRQYGDKLAFWGTIGTQTTMPFGTPEQVRQTVRHMIETVGQGGGLLLAPTHVLEPDVPWENIVAFFEAVEQFGRYD